MKIIIWKDEINGEFRCRQISPYEEVYELGLMVLWQNESSNNFVIKNFKDAESIFETIEEELRELCDGNVDLDNVDFQKQNVYCILGNKCFVGNKYLTFYEHDGKMTALVDIDDSVDIYELTQREMLDLIRSA